MLYGSVLVLMSVFLLILIGVKRTREIEPEILSVLLRYGEMYGLQILDAIGQDFGTRPGWGILYPGLRQLERRGFVVSRWGEERPEIRGGARRRYYRRTGKRSKLKDRKERRLWIGILSPSKSSTYPLCLGTIVLSC